jgi:hypothetical protein
VYPSKETTVYNQYKNVVTKQPVFVKIGQEGVAGNHYAHFIYDGVEMGYGVGKSKEEALEKLACDLAYRVALARDAVSFLEKTY